MGPPARPVPHAEPAGNLLSPASPTAKDTACAAVKPAVAAKQSQPAAKGAAERSPLGRGQLPSPLRPPQAPRAQLSAGGSSAGGAGTAASPPAGPRSLLTGSAGGGGHRQSLAASGTSMLGSKGRDALRPATMLFNAETAAGFRQAFVVTPVGHSVALPYEQLKPGAFSALTVCAGACTQCPRYYCTVYRYVSLFPSNSPRAQVLISR